MATRLLALFAAALLVPSHAKVVNFATDCGAKANDDAWDVALKNGAQLNATLNQLQPGDVFVVPAGQTFYLMGGIIASNLVSVVLQIDGTLEFASTTLDMEKYIREWPRSGPGSSDSAPVLECLQFNQLQNVTFTSSGEGQINGAGAKWYLTRKENRPRLLHIRSSRDVTIEKLYLKDSPYWTFLGDGIANLVVRYSRIEVRRTKDDGHSVVDLSAFNTDGFDLGSCNGVHIHDSSVWNQDDCFDVKDNTQNVLIERVNASGLGLTIGSIGGSNVNNITFRDAYMHHTVKGTYMKFRGNGNVSNVLYENVVMDAPEQFGVWIGPAQQCDGCSATDICSPHPCSICWPEVPGTECNAPASSFYTNITLRNITINNPKKSAGVLIANESSPMLNVVFDNVVVNNPADKPWGNDGYYCKNVQGVAIGSTNPVPPCFKNSTGTH